jgi:hypothetical protein
MVAWQGGGAGVLLSDKHIAQRITKRVILVLYLEGGFVGGVSDDGNLGGAVAVVSHEQRPGEGGAIAVLGLSSGCHCRRGRVLAVQCCSSMAGSRPGIQLP